MMNIHFDPTVEGGREARGGQRLAVVVENREGGDSYKTQSKGEKARVDVCVLLAIRQLMAQRMAYTFDQLFIDEVFDGLDAEGVERVAGLLRSEFPNMPIFIITHNDSLKGLMNQTISVRKRNGCSTIGKIA
jgi:DNA repair exonuclease SbcCD ATPase subunit